MLTCQAISINFDNKNIINNLGFTAGAQSIILLRGSNGTGKTTLLKIITGLLLPTTGEVLWCKTPIAKYYNIYTASIAYFGHKTALQEHLTVFEYLQYWSLIRNTEEAIIPTIEYFQLHKILNIKCFKLSYGWKKRVAFARLFLFNAEMWLLDEPFIGLDKEAVGLFINAIQIKSDQGGIIIISDNQNINLKNSSTIELQNFL